jgi:hypothetical protein
MSDCFLPITNKLGLEEGFLSELTELHVPMEVTRSFSAALLRRATQFKQVSTTPFWSAVSRK